MLSRQILPWLAATLFLACFLPLYGESPKLEQKGSEEVAYNYRNYPDRGYRYQRPYRYDRPYRHNYRYYYGPRVYYYHPYPNYNYYYQGPGGYYYAPYHQGRGGFGVQFYLGR